MSIGNSLRLVLATTLASLALGCEASNHALQAKPAPQRAATASATAAAPTPNNAGDWNDSQIDWMGFDEGLAVAKSEHKPVCLLFFTEWCPHCNAYRGVFSDPQVVEKAKLFVMIRLDRDKNEALSTKYAPDGEYIPRTLFLSSDGTMDPTIHAQRPQYQYFYDEQNPGSLMAGMDEALEKLR